MIAAGAMVMLSPEQWATSPGLFSNPPNVYFGCRWCQAPVRYSGLLTNEGYAVELAKCEGCGAAFSLLLHGWATRSAVVVPAGVAQPFVARTDSPFRASGPFEEITTGGHSTRPLPIGQADGDAD